MAGFGRFPPRPPGKGRRVVIPPVRPGAANAARPAGSARGPLGFRLPGTAGPSAAAPVAGVGGLLGLQEDLSPEARDDAARRRGHALLEELDGLQRDLLRGRDDPQRLSRLALLAEGEAGHDPALREAVEAISLRARVELARRVRR